ncbi:hypothetical protein HPB48_004205 [Haemaphysalis longicornis]|uniref:Uncharacterized protein n=1 Tax=Haemaphysalis longicornis TaxID=44386 RepID=A0A9J6GT84_HAELO|nr:hypothetical protein HPB48_004205 [Haemaphysalis longicornis]
MNAYVDPNTKKCGVDLNHYMHAAKTGIHRSTKVDETIRYLSLHDNKHILNLPWEAKKMRLIFAVGFNSELVKLYDLRTFDKGPFNIIKPPQDRDGDWTGRKFSRGGKSILISTDGPLIHLIDAFQCKTHLYQMIPGSPVFTEGTIRLTQRRQSKD